VWDHSLVAFYLIGYPSAPRTRSRSAKKTPPEPEPSTQTPSPNRHEGGQAAEGMKSSCQRGEGYLQRLAGEEMASTRKLATTGLTAQEGLDRSSTGRTAGPAWLVWDQRGAGRTCGMTGPEAGGAGSGVGRCLPVADPVVVITVSVGC
jgi:hypothetical protein